MKDFSDILWGIIGICAAIALCSFFLSVAVFLWRNFA